MKKLFLLAALPMMLLCSCNGSNNSGSVPEEKREKVTLSLSNYTDYIAVYKETVAFSDSTSYYLNFYGSTLCKFDNTVITYTLSGQSKIDDGTAEYQTYKLTISGCGQIYSGYSSRYGSSSAIITKVTGTVEILY